MSVTTDLKAACEAFKQHLEERISEDLVTKLKGRGLSDVKIHQVTDTQQYGAIRQRVVSGETTRLTEKEILFIADRVITPDPAARFYEVHPALLAEIQKYRIVNRLLQSVDDPQFRRLFRQGLSGLLNDKDKDPVAQQFVTRIGKAIGVDVSSSILFFASQTSAVNDTTVPTLDKERRRP